MSVRTARQLGVDEAELVAWAKRSAASVAEGKHIVAAEERYRCEIATLLAG